MTPIVVIELAVFTVVLPWLFRGSFTVDPERAAGVMDLNEREAIRDTRLLVTCGAPLPEALASLASLYGSAGVGTFGDFLHFVAPHHMSTHRELIGHLLDEADEELIAPTADVIVFAQSDNGDMCGWHTAALAAGDDRVVRLDGFDEEPLTDSTERFLAGLPHTDYFGVGVLPATYTRHDWL